MKWNERSSCRRQAWGLVFVCTLAVWSGCSAGRADSFPGFEGLFDEGRQLFYETLIIELVPMRAVLAAGDASRIERARDQIPFLYENLINITYLRKAHSFGAHIERGDPDSLARLRSEYLELCRETARQFIRSLAVRSTGFEGLLGKVGNAGRTTLDLVLGSIGRNVIAAADDPAPDPDALALDLGGYYRQSALALARFDAAHELTEAAGVKVAIVSTGINLAHPIFKDVELDLDHSFSLIGRRRPPWEKEEVALSDFDGRGTAMASIVRVFAPQAEIRVYRIGCDPDPPYSYWAAMQLAQAIRRAAADGADVIAVDGGFDDDYPFLRAACQFAYEHDAIIVAPNPSRTGSGVGTSKIFPAQYNSTIAVTGVLESTPGRAVPWEAALPRHSTDVAAPATLLVAAPDEVSTGTSHLVTADYGAVAVTASLVALIQSRVEKVTEHLPGEHFQRIYEILTSTCDPGKVGFTSFAPQIGYGLIDAAAAVGDGLAVYEERMRVVEEAQRRRAEERAAKAKSSG